MFTIYLDRSSNLSKSFKIKKIEKNEKIEVENKRKILNRFINLFALYWNVGDTISIYICFS